MGTRPTLPIILGFLVVLAEPSCGFLGSDSDSDDCPVGGESCDCTAGGACDDDLTCLSGKCVTRSGTGGDMDTPSSENVKGDPCNEAGGMRTPEGACYLECTYDDGALGNDLFGDCAPLKMVCGGGYCVPGGSTCSTDNDCGQGWRCQKWRGGTCTLSCALRRACENSHDYCVASCPRNNDVFVSLPACLDGAQQNTCREL